MRVVFDTNVLVTLTRREELASFRKAIVLDQLTLVTSGFILDELERVLHQKFSLTIQKARITAKIFARLSVVANPVSVDRICRDPNDDYILAAAISGQAEYIVTADKDLHVVGKYKNIRIISRAEFKDILKN